MPPVEPRERHWELAAAAVRDGEGQRALLAGDTRTAEAAFAAAADLYRQSWDLAPPGSYGRLVGMMKAAVLAGDGAAEAQYVRAALSDGGADSPAASYARAIAALVLGDDATAVRSAAVMRTGSDAFTRAADAIAAVASRSPTRRSCSSDWPRRGACRSTSRARCSAGPRLRRPRGAGLESRLRPTVPSTRFVVDRGRGAAQNPRSLNDRQFRSAPSCGLRRVASCL
jgi:hypothetical protein